MLAVQPSRSEFDSSVFMWKGWSGSIYLASQHGGGRGRRPSWTQWPASTAESVSSGRKVSKKWKWKMDEEDTWWQPSAWPHTVIWQEGMQGSMAFFLSHGKIRKCKLGKGFHQTLGLPAPWTQMARHLYNGLYTKKAHVLRSGFPRWGHYFGGFWKL